MYIVSNFTVFIIYVTWVPNTTRYIFIWHFVKDTITSKYNIIVIFRNLKNFYVWNTSHYVRVAPTKFYFCLWITKGSRYWKSSGQYSNRAYNVIWISFFILPVYLLSTWCSGSLVNLSTRSNNPLIFSSFRWFMILA